MGTKEINDALRIEVEETLHAAGIYDVESFGWLDADRPDPKFIGHAMWQVEPPVDIDWSGFSARRPFRELPPAIMSTPAWLKALQVSGTDFTGLLKAARMSIGLFLVQIKIVDFFSYDDMMDMHRMSAIIYLATATDRLREFLIAAAFHESPKEYLHRGDIYKSKKRSWYSTPFSEAADMTGAAALAKLQPMASRIQNLRITRNKLVHEISTSMARHERARIEEPRSNEREPMDFKELQSLVALAKKENESKKQSAINELAGWYHVLIGASNEAFIFENETRRAAQRGNQF